MYDPKSKYVNSIRPLITEEKSKAHELGFTTISIPYHLEEKSIPSKPVRPSPSSRPIKSQGQHNSKTNPKLSKKEISTQSLGWEPRQQSQSYMNM